MIKRKLAARLVCLSLWLACASAAWAQQPQLPDAAPKQEPPAAKKNARPPAEAAPPPAEPFDKATPAEMSSKCVTLETAAGNIVIEMLAEAAPETARNFLNLAAAGTFDTTVFSRVVPGFVVQGGNLATRERLTPDILKRARRTVPDEPNAVKHERGVVSMARSSEANSATTHFFILVSDSPHLDGTFAAFGRVRAGMEAVDAMNKAEIEGDKPKKPVRLDRATVAACAPQAK